MLHANPFRALRRRLSREDGITVIEVMVALLVLVVGIFGTFTAFEASQRLSLVSERHAAMSQIAQREIERIEGLSYDQVGLDCGSSTPNACPTPSSSASSPDYYVGSGGTTFRWDRTGGQSAEALDIDTLNGTIAPVTSWNQNSGDGGDLSGEIHDYVTWATDGDCGTGCTGPNYKRITVAVTITKIVNGQEEALQPNPVFVSSILAPPEATFKGAVQNGTNTNNPLNDPSTVCQIASGTTGPCTAGIDTGTANTYFLHDWAATNSGTPTAPSADHSTHATSGILSSGMCALTTGTANSSTETGCPTPDLMDTNPPAGTTSSQLYNYSRDQCADTCYPGGRELPPTCATGVCAGSTGGGTGSTSDCTANSWSTSLLNNLSHLWVTPTLPTAMKLTGDGGLTIFTQTLQSVAQTATFCVQVYDVPPSGSAGSLADIEAWRPVSLGGAAYVPPTDPTTGSNWPETESELSFVFNFRGSNGAVTVPTGDRIGLRVWMASTVNSAFDVIYDNPNYPAQLQLNSQ